LYADDRAYGRPDLYADPGANLHAYPDPDAHAYTHADPDAHLFAGHAGPGAAA
jgi:hypothetical protein